MTFPIGENAGLSTNATSNALNSREISYNTTSNATGALAAASTVQSSRSSTAPASASEFARSFISIITHILTSCVNCLNGVIRILNARFSREANVQPQPALVAAQANVQPRPIAAMQNDTIEEEFNPSNFANVLSSIRNNWTLTLPAFSAPSSDSFSSLLTHIVSGQDLSSADLNLLNSRLNLGDLRAEIRNMAMERQIHLNSERVEQIKSNFFKALITLDLLASAPTALSPNPQTQQLTKQLNRFVYLAHLLLTDYDRLMNSNENRRSLLSNVGRAAPFAACDCGHIYEWAHDFETDEPWVALRAQTNSNTSTTAATRSV